MPEPVLELMKSTMEHVLQPYFLVAFYFSNDLLNDSSPIHIVLLKCEFSDILW